MEWGDTLPMPALVRFQDFQCHAQGDSWSMGLLEVQQVVLGGNKYWHAMTHRGIYHSQFGGVHWHGRVKGKMRGTSKVVPLVKQ